MNYSPHRKLISSAFIVTALLMFSSPTFSAGKKIVCWKNNEGVRECGNAVPPEYAQGRVERKSAMGMTVEKLDRAKTQEELDNARQERIRVRKEQAEQRRIDEAKARKDRVLLQTFTTEEDLKLARDGNIAAIDSRIRHSEQQVDKLKETHDEMQSEAAQVERGGSKVPQELRSKITSIQNQIDNTMAQIDQRGKEKVQVQEQFELDLARYRELKRR